MRGRAGTGGNEAAPTGVVHVVLMVGGIEVLAVPAGREVVDGHDAGLAGRRRQGGGLGETRHDVAETGVPQTGVLAVLAAGGTDGHAEALVVCQSRGRVRLHGGEDDLRS